MEKILKNKKFFIIVLLVLGCFATFSAASALEVGWPKSPMGTDIMQLDKEKKLNIVEFTKYLYEWGIALGGVATFVAFVIAGFQYITSIGNPQTMKDAIARIKSAMFGLVMLLSSYVLLETINPELVSFKLKPFSPQEVGDFYQECGEGKAACREGFECLTTSKDKAGKETGICVARNEEVTPCSSAMIYSETNFDGTEEKIVPDQTIESSPKSVRAYYYDKDQKKDIPCDKKEITDPMDKNKKRAAPDYSGCGCFLQLMNKAGNFLWSECGDRIVDVAAYEQDLTRWADRDVFCVKLISPKPGE